MRLTSTVSFSLQHSSTMINKTNHPPPPTRHVSPLAPPSAFHFRPIRRRLLSVSASRNGSPDPAPPQEGGRSEEFLRKVMGGMEAVYLDRNPTARSVLEIVRSADGPICYDHLAFRTLRALPNSSLDYEFGFTYVMKVSGHGIDAMARLFLDYGYKQQEELRFPAKKLKASWLSPPDYEHPDENGSGGGIVHGPLPRIFISELLVDQLIPDAQEIIRKYVTISGAGYRYAALASALGSLTWKKPLHSEFLQLAKESESAAWTLVNGYALNHLTISTHRLKSRLSNIKDLNQFLESSGFKLNSEGGVLKVSPDGGLLQSSTVADSTTFEFSDGTVESVPCSYIEFAQRLVLPQYKHLPGNEVKEIHRRDGFEVGNADKIFESTSQGQLTRRAT